MLKIKDSVDLKELEKFGFKEDESNINEGCSSKYASLDNYYRTLTKADKLSKNKIILPPQTTFCTTRRLQGSSRKLVAYKINLCKNYLHCLLINKIGYNHLYLN